MSKTKIEWADATWNPVTGCTKISPACDNCYAERMAKRLAGRVGYPKDEPFRVTLHPDRLDQPLKWKKPKRIFVVSMGDLFHENVPESYIAAIFAVAAAAPQHTFMVLTKRPKRMAAWFQWLSAEYNGPCDQNAVLQTCFGEYGWADQFDDAVASMLDAAWPLPNVWLGVTAEDQQRADERIPWLLKCPAAVRFVSAEPLLGPIDLSLLRACVDCGSLNRHCGLLNDEDELYCGACGCKTFYGVDWVIVGGESGQNARPSHPEWFRGLRDQCKAAGVPFFFKQWGEWAPLPCIDPHFRASEVRTVGADNVRMCRVGKKAAGRLLDGREWNELPGSANERSVT